MKLGYLTLLNLIITTLFVYGQSSSIAEECIPVNKLLNKDQSNNCCSEEGIKCDGNHIIEIYLTNTKYNGSIPSEFGNLSMLERLYLFHNELTGSIPPELGKLSNLKTLDLGYNKLEGSIPKEIGDLSKLVNLDLSNNNLSGSIPKEFGNFNELFSLNLSYNKLSGSIPLEIEKLNKLIRLNISYNDFCGDVPELSCDINIYGNKNLGNGNKCPEDDSQQNNDNNSNNSTNNETSKNNDTDNTQKKDNGKSQGTILIIVGIIAVALIIFILVYIKNNKKVKNDNKIKINDESSDINNHHSGNDNSPITKKDLSSYTFIEDKYFEWKIENWNQLKDEEYSSIFDAHEHLWRLMLITNNFDENNEESVDVGLSLCDDINDNEYIYTNFVIYFRNYSNPNVYKTVEYGDEPTFYNAQSLDHGINNAILISELNDKTKEGRSILENNKIIIGVLIKFYSYNPSVSLTFN